MNRTHFRRVGGGCINHCFAVEVGQDRYFLKLNDALKFPGMFRAEARGLQLLSRTGGVRVPEVLAYGQGSSGLSQLKAFGVSAEELPVSWDHTSFLLLEWIPSGRAAPDQGEQLGLMLAQCHEKTALEYGLDHENYIGSLPQQNRSHTTWAQFYAEERILPLTQRARDRGLLNPAEQKRVQDFTDRLPDIFDESGPRLLHGDLWSGNFMSGPAGEPVLVDPAVYYGHPLMDIAMTRLFGGFPESFYHSYHQIVPAPPHYHEALEAATVYPLLVHLLLFGQSYKGQLMSLI